MLRITPLLIKRLNNHLHFTGFLGVIGFLALLITFNMAPPSKRTKKVHPTKAKPSIQYPIKLKLSVSSIAPSADSA